MKRSCLAPAVLWGVLGALAPAASSPPAGRRIDPPAAPGSMAPNLAMTSGGILLSWLEPLDADAKPGEGDYALRYSRLRGGRWSAPGTVASGKDFFANWADFPSIVQARAGWLLAHWAGKSGPDTYAYDVRLARAERVEGPWRLIGNAHEDSTETEHGFVSFLPEGEEIRAFWLDGREMEGHEAGNMTLRTAAIGARPGAGDRLDARVCECCQTSAAMTSRGPIVVFRDRSEDEIRDISIIRRVEGRWTSPRPVAKDGWKIPGCPVNGPAVAAAEEAVGVAWFSGAQEKARVQVALSRDAGETFGRPILVDGAGPLGRVDLLLDAGGDAVVLWVAAEGKNASIRMRRVRRDGRVGPPVVVAPTSVARTSGFPRAEWLGEREALVVWVEAGDTTRLRAAALPAPPA